jgi:hypothetical protein
VKATNARQFLDEIADVLRASGRPVEITETEESFGTFVWLSSVAPRWYDRSISLSARKSNRTGRWALGELKVGSTVSTKAFTRTSRSSIRIAAEVYA